MEQEANSGMFKGGYQIRDPQGIYFLTCTVVEWIDVFSRPIYADLVIESLKFCIREKGLQVHAWVLMSNHLHLIASAKEGFDLSDVLRDFKKFTAGKILQTLTDLKTESRKNWMLWLFRKAGTDNVRNHQFQFWIQDNHPVELNNQARLKQRLQYLHENPVRAGLVWQPWEYRYSSAIDYMKDQPGLVPISYL
jgi:putative transposase